MTLTNSRAQLPQVTLDQSQAWSVKLRFLRRTCSRLKRVVVNHLISRLTIRGVIRLIIRLIVREACSLHQCLYLFLFPFLLGNIHGNVVQDPGEYFRMMR